MQLTIKTYLQIDIHISYQYNSNFILITENQKYLFTFFSKQYYLIKTKKVKFQYYT